TATDPLLRPPRERRFARLVPNADPAPETKPAGMVTIQRGGEGGEELWRDEALTIPRENGDDACGFPPYPEIEHFLHSRNGDDLVGVERGIIDRALGETPATLLKSETRDWYVRLPEIVEARISANGNGNGHARRTALAA